MSEDDLIHGATSEQIECPHFGRMIYPAECALCSGAAAKLTAEVGTALEIRYAFVARYASPMHNDHCQHTIRENENIFCLSDGTFVCADCAEGLGD